MSILPELEVLEQDAHSIRYLEHGWPHQLCRWHSHKECEIHLIVATKGKTYIGDYIGDFRPGDLFLTGPHLPHNWITDEVYNEEVDLRDMVIQFDQNRIEELMGTFPEFNDIRETLKLAASGIFFDGFDLNIARPYFETVRDTRGPMRILAFLELISKVHEHKNKRSLSVLNLYHENRSAKQERIINVVDHVVHHFSEDFSVDSAATMAGMSAASFSRNFQRVTGKRFVEFVNRVRIGQACGLLYASDEQITSICFQVGFQNLANFNRHFLKMKGMTPSEYRDTARRELMRPSESAE
ncbi:MAG: AraC family transcriptional regulator [Rhodobacteraceae bacterium]|nr:MAG: AraC family transcriptional regulator [Paracoccaceae bacterium]